MHSLDIEHVFSISSELLNIYDRLETHNNLEQLTADVEDCFSQQFKLPGTVLTRSGQSGFVGFLRAVGIGPGDEVILPVSICQSMVNAVMFAGAIPVLADIKIDLSLSPEDTVRCLTPQTKAIVTWHPYGLAVDLEWLHDIVRQCDHRVYIVEDCAQSLGAILNGTTVGNRGDISIFSFAYGKPLSAGLGGAVCTPNKQLLQQIRRRCRSGALGYTDHEFLGENSTVPSIYLLLLLQLIQHFPELLQKKLVKASRYKSTLQRYGAIIDTSRAEKQYDVPHVYHRVILEINTDNNSDIYYRIITLVREELSTKAIDTVQETFSHPLYSVSYVNEYYRFCCRPDLIDESGNSFRVWKDTINRYLYFRTNDYVKLADIDHTSEAIGWALNSVLSIDV